MLPPLFACGLRTRPALAVLAWSGDSSPIRGCTATSGDRVPPRTPKLVISPQNRHHLNTPAGSCPQAGWPAVSFREPAVTDQLIAPVIPPANGPARGRSGRAGAGRPLPLAGPLPVPLDAVYGMSRIDASGSHLLGDDVVNARPDQPEAED